MYLAGIDIEEKTTGIEECGGAKKRESAALGHIERLQQQRGSPRRSILRLGRLVPPPQDGQSAAFVLEAIKIKREGGKQGFHPLYTHRTTSFCQQTLVGLQLALCLILQSSCPFGLLIYSDCLTF